MKSTLFMYLDILGFTELIKEKKRVEQLYKIIDDLNAHRDANYRTIVFSDTLLIYNTTENLNDWYKSVELMYLIEFAQDLFRRLIGRDIYFRAIITEGEFYHSKLKNIEAYYGQALIDTHREESGLVGTGLFLDASLVQWNRFSKHMPSSDKYHFVCLTRQLTFLSREDWEFPLPSDVLTEQGLDYEVYEEARFLCGIYDLMNNHPVPKVRDKYLATWNMYASAYPKLVDSFLKAGLSPNGIAEMDWSSVESEFEKRLNESEDDPE